MADKIDRAAWPKTPGYGWGDAEWMSERAKNAASPRGRPMNLYAMHTGSWRRGDNGALLSYAEIAELLAPYVKDMGYTHIGLTAGDGENLWGFFADGFVAAASQYGDPRGFMELVDRCHRAGVGVVMDWTPPECLGFDFGSRGVCAALTSEALFWIEVFHLDGLRADISDMLYPDRILDKDRADIRNARADTNASAFLGRLCRTVADAFPGALMIAEQRFDGIPVTLAAESGGLGFSMKWNSEWQDNTLSFISLERELRPYGYERLADAAGRVFSERHILPMPHSEAAGRSLIDRIPGGMDDKFAGARVYLAFMTAHPGKKLLFMGCELGQLSEWNPEYSLDWHLLDSESHRVFRDYVRALNRLYLETPALWDGDFSPGGFEWLCRDDPQGGTLAFYRASLTHAGGGLIAVFNFSATARIGYRVGVPELHGGDAARAYREAFNSDNRGFGGRGAVNTGVMTAKPLPWNGRARSIQLNLPPCGAVFLTAAEQ